MPIYEFHCEKCEKDSEILVRSTDWKGTKCPHCGSTKLDKKLSVFAASATSDSGACGDMPACAMNGGPVGGGGCGGCCGGGPHRH
ncbi:MAG TPA: zinc ribbon domain-containing protein [Candidatus Sulfotelmatobacter sp.]|nr:zinc ribbon domain-containing protein [Candidatus Sulfotelmatobacter sp.]HWI59562.1 zinc ribbon domain-containing protein [Bacillota bacterium]